MSYLTSRHVEIGDVSDFHEVYQTMDKFIADSFIKKRDALRLRLLTEEVLRLAKSILVEEAVILWLEGNSRVAYINLTADNDLDANQRAKLISISSASEGSKVGFFDKLLSMFIANPPTEKRWSLKDYQEELLQKRADDKYSQEAWEDLERSLVANLADDIEISIKFDKIHMKVTKDFSEALCTVGSRVPQVVTDYMFITSGNINMEKAADRAEELIEDLGIGKKDELHMKLLFEETVGMLQAMVGEYHVALYMERYKNEACIKLTAKTEMDADKKKHLIEVSKRHNNMFVKGFMDKVREVIENGLLNYDNVMKLEQQYGFNMVDYGSMGIYSHVEGMADSGVMWSLAEYRQALKDASETSEAAEYAWDELEKSIVASLAKDVLVGVKGNRVDMTLVYDLE
ncbi:hypothetical protein NXH67_02025 [Butyrivibrio sp. DSM 10294]|uniref:hypothetical protein n=1 Tax=Butyrivibrio sp. DSM 10294 TaxID=2972457 RepID=UPI00234E949E|nr:hypothetical protein [Butyrivibrio sp. DSM 10294]MDC7292294.1 hypothetical protein [Butyrivibrio sp. DSM 10294]